ncbi:HAD-IA family hydrolase [Candidatus Dojkabacteria bacterium]|nr:HAD-IA family hydrolase [Candidatus Dojkabacteria bacterium]
MKKAVLWDLDNTLYDYDIAHNKSIAAIYNIVSKEYNVSKNIFQQLYELSRREIHIELEGTASSHNRILYFQRIFEHLRNQTNSFTPISAEFILSLYDNYWDVYFDNMILFPNAKEILEQLRIHKIKMAIVSDLTTSIQLRKLKRLGIASYFDEIITSEETGSDKPSSIMFLKALHKLNTLPQDALMIGDNAHTDIEGANAVNIETVLFIKPGNHSINDTEEGYRKAKYVINNLIEVSDIAK